MAPNDLISSFAAGRTSVTVPFDLVDNHIYLDAKLNGRPYRLLCDTGGSNVITPEVAKALGVRPEGAVQGQGAGERSEDEARFAISPTSNGRSSASRSL